MEREWTRVIASDRVGGQCVPVFVGVRRMLLVRTKVGLRAFPDRCPHAGAPLRNGKCEAGGITCLRHGWTFRLSDGSCPAHPLYSLSLWDVREAGGWIELRPPEGAEPF